jgi:hypothetical protein
LPPLEEPALENFVSIVLSRCPSSDLVFGFCLAFDHLFEIFVHFFPFSFLPKLVTMDVVNALIKREIEDYNVREPVDGHSLVMSD